MNGDVKGMTDAFDALESAGRYDEWEGEQIDGPDGFTWVRRDAAAQWRARALAAEAERTELREVQGLWRDEALISALFEAHTRGDLRTILREALNAAS